MNNLPPGIEALSAKLFTRVYKRILDQTRRQIKATFGQMWHGDKIQWPYLQSGHGYELTLSGTQSLTIHTGFRAATATITLDATRPYTVFPQIYAFVQTASDTHTEDYRVFIKNLSRTTGPYSATFDLTVLHQPISPLTIGVDGAVTTQTALAGASIANNPAWSGVAGANGSGGAGATGSAGNTASSANGAGANHSHTENTAATYTQNATTGTNSNTHTHTGPSHTHTVGDAQHTHTMVNINHQHGLTIDTLTVSLTPNVGADVTLTIAWLAVGLQTPPS